MAGGGGVSVADYSRYSGNWSRLILLTIKLTHHSVMMMMIPLLKCQNCNSGV